MTGISNGFSYGVQCLNSALGFTGRCLPTSMDQFKGNVSKNLYTCAKMTTAFLSSSIGLGVSMGVLGVATASFCSGTDLLKLFPSVWCSPLYITPSFAHLCFNGYPGLGNQIPLASILNDTSKGTLCSSSQQAMMNISCVLFNDYHRRYPNESIPQCLNNLEYSTYVYMDKSPSGGNWSVYDNLSCQATKGLVKIEEIEHVNNISYGDGLLSQRCCSNRNKKNMIGFLPRLGIQVLCWPGNMSDIYSSVFVSRSSCNMSVPNVDSSMEYSHRPACVAEKVCSNCDCSKCNVSVIAFGAGSALVLVATVVKLIYYKYKTGGSLFPIRSSVYAKRLADLTVSARLLLGASGIGSGVFIASLISPCDPVSMGMRSAMAVSTALYWSSVGCRLFCSSPVKEDSNEEEVVVVLLDTLGEAS